MVIKKTDLLFVASCFALSVPVNASEVSPIQSSSSPYGLSPIALVQTSGSDSDAIDFNQEALPDIQTVVNTVLTENQSLGTASTIALNPSDLVLSESASVRVYFVGEGAGYANTLGFYTGDSSDALSGDASLIFPNASTSSSYLSPEDSIETINNTTPLAVGDFVDLGTYESGTQLNLFLIANGANGGSQTFYSDLSLNSDGIDHFVVLAVPDSPYILIGVEDLTGGGDEDYNDVVFVLDIGSTNTQQLISNAAPLPGLMAGFIGPLVLSAFLFRRRKKNL